MSEKKCYHCSLTLEADECGLAEIEARWVDADGEVSATTRLICWECLDAGSPGGPGYREVS